MNASLINTTTHSVPIAFVTRWVKRLSRKLKISSHKKLTLVIVGAARSRSLNHRFRKKDKPTDVLSFESHEKAVLGELVLCWPLVRRQATQHGLRFEEELGYLILHGVLHLLGYEHERGGREAKRMFALQDRLFEDLCVLQWGVRTRKRNQLRGQHGDCNRNIRNQKPHRKAQGKGRRLAEVSLTSARKKVVSKK